MTRSEFETIAVKLHQKALKVCLDFWSSKDDAEDAAQETMIQLWRYLEHIDAERSVEALAVRVAKNCCVSMYRKQQHREVGPILDSTKDYPTNTHDSDPQGQLEAQDTQRMLNEALDLLKPRERQLFDMRAMIGLSIDEIASQTGIPKLSVTAMVSAARKKVFTELRRRIKQ